jgi:regulator of nonsense transcripts 2
MSLLDAPKDFFRVRLCCVLLETCGLNFSRGKTGKKLDSFLIFLQLYFYTKREAPLEIIFLLTDLIEKLRPHSRLLSSYEEAAKLFNDVVIKEMNHPQVDNNNLEESDHEDLDIRDEPLDNQLDENVEVLSSSSGEENQLEEDKDVEEEEEDEDDEDDDFEQELGKMMISENRRLDRKIIPFDASVPVRATRPVSDVKNHVIFTLMTKKGSKNQVLLEFLIL